MQVPKIDYELLRENSVWGRYVINDTIAAYLENSGSLYKVETIGKSVEKRPIQMITLGNGQSKILMWSQMHGNESTTTKAVLDFINWVRSSSKFAGKIQERCTIKIIPMLNPDGAVSYTRANANKIDLNRDAQERTQPESKVLRKVFDSFKPDYAFNLHDQRTIFNVGQTPKPATVSFLAPAHDEIRSVSDSRKVSMQLIVTMNHCLQQLIPGQVGRFDDSFNSNCVGDCFQMLGTPTILFEAGHFPDDYERERTRECIFWALSKAIEVITVGRISEYDAKDYFSIPENNKLFFDVLVKNVHVLSSLYDPRSSIGMLYEEVLKDGAVSFELQIAEIGMLDTFFGHKTYDCTVMPDFLFLKEGNNPITKLIC